MDIYIAIYLLLAILSILATIAKKKNIFAVITFLIIVGVRGLRWRTGTDWEPYYHCFIVANTEKVNYVEYGYFLLNWIIRSFTDSYTVFLIIESCIISICQWKFASYFKVHNIAIILFSFFCGTIFPVRFTLAVAIFLLGYSYIEERKLIKFLIISGIAVSIHQIIVLTIPLYFIVNRNYTTKILYIIYGSSCLIGLFSEMVFGNIMNIVNAIFMYMPTFSQEKAIAYLDGNDYSRSLLANFLSFTNGAVLIYILCYIRKRYHIFSKYDVLLNMYVFGLSISRLVLSTIPYLARINMCCSGGLVVMLMIGIERTSKYKIPFVMLLILYFISSYISNIDAYPDLYIPYYSIFSNSQRPLVY